MPTNNEIFREFVRGHKPALPIMPAVHIARGVKINEIFATNKLRLNLAKNYNEELVYLFYGKSSYRLKSDANSVSLLIGDAAVCFVLNVNKLPDAHRVFALDTGASFRNRYDGYFSGGGVSIDDFKLDSSDNSAAKLVSAFFGNNKNYFGGNAKPNIRIAGLDIISDVYRVIATAGVSGSFDERARTCELQYGVDIEINNNSLYTIIMPDRLSGDNRCKAKDEWGVSPITYMFRGGKPGDRTEIVFEKLGEYYAQKSLSKVSDAKLVYIHNQIPSVAGFTIPIFEKNGKRYVQNSVNGVIESFDPVEISEQFDFD